MFQRFFLLLFVLIAIAQPVHAKSAHSNTSGCIDSPEAPTLILAMVSGSGLLVARLRMRK